MRLQYHDTQAKDITRKGKHNTPNTKLLSGRVASQTQENTERSLYHDQVGLTLGTYKWAKPLSVNVTQHIFLKKKMKEKIRNIVSMNLEKILIKLLLMIKTLDNIG